MFNAERVLFRGLRRAREKEPRVSSGLCPLSMHGLRALSGIAIFKICQANLYNFSCGRAVVVGPELGGEATNSASLS